MACVLMVNGQTLNSIGYVRYAESMGHIYELASVSIANLKFVPEFPLDPGRRLWLLSATGQEQVVLKINDLREDCRPLTNLLRVLWCLAICRDELQAYGIDDTAGFLDVLASEVGPPEYDAASTDGQHSLHLETVVVPFLYFGQFFPHKLGIFRLEMESGRSACEILGEEHPV